MSTLIDHEALNRFTEGDQELLSEMAMLFAKYVPDMETRLHMALASRDTGMLMDVTHLMRTRVGYFSATAILKQIEELETMVRTNGIETASSLVDAIFSNVQVLLGELETMTQLQLKMRPQD